MYANASYYLKQIYYLAYEDETMILLVHKRVFFIERGLI